MLATLKHSTIKHTSHVLLKEHLQLPAEDPMRQYAHATLFDFAELDASSCSYDEEDFIVDIKQRRATTDVLPPATGD